MVIEFNFNILDDGLLHQFRNGNMSAFEEQPRMNQSQQYNHGAAGAWQQNHEYDPHQNSMMMNNTGYNGGAGYFEQDSNLFQNQ